MNNPPITTTFLACLAHRSLQCDKALGLAQPGRQTRLLLQAWFEAKRSELAQATLNAATLNASIQAGRETVAKLVAEAESATPERLTSSAGMKLRERSAACGMRTSYRFSDEYFIHPSIHIHMFYDSKYAQSMQIATIVLHQVCRLAGNEL